MGHAEQPIVTIFSVPKPFSGHIRVIQRNAIRSWVSLGPEAEIILIGDEPGTSDSAGEFGVHHVPDVRRNEFGTPLLSSIFESADKVGTAPLQAYVNADIILCGNFIRALRSLQFGRFLVVGHRWCLKILEEIECSNQDWEDCLRERLVTEATLDRPSAIDYFVFPRGLYPKIPPFALGRTAWDNWLIFEAERLGAKVVNATEVVTAVHQDHSYGHHAQGKEGIWGGPEAESNLQMAGGLRHCYTMRDAGWLLGKDGLRRASLYERYAARRLHRLATFYPRKVPQIRKTRMWLKKRWDSLRILWQGDSSASKQG